MKITHVRAIPVKGRHWPRFRYREVGTDEGVVGISEALAFQTTGVVQSVETVGEWLLGENRCRSSASGSGASAGGGAFGAERHRDRPVGHRWPVAGMPIYQLLGGACHDRIRVYADGFFRGATPTPESYREKAAAAVAQGFTALKLDVDDFLTPGARKVLIRCHGDALGRGIANAEVRRVEESVAAIREHLGPEVDLALDCHWAFDLPGALRLGRALEPYHLMWFEDPIPPAISRVGQTARAQCPSIGEALCASSSAKCSARGSQHHHARRSAPGLSR